MFDIDEYNKIIRNKYDILKTRIMLTSDNSFVKEFENTVKEIEKNSEKEYEKNLKDNLYITTSLEEEKVRLEKLTNCIDKRMKEQSEIIKDFRTLTNKGVVGLSEIKESNKIHEYKMRLNTIEMYLQNIGIIKDKEQELKNLNKKLDIELKEKEENNKINYEIEKEIEVSFKDTIDNSELASSLINSEYNEIEFKKELEDKKSSLDVILKSYNNILGQGISGVTKDEYSSYVLELKEDYYVNKLKEELFSVKKLLSKKVSSYEDLIEKVESIKNIVEDDDTIRKELNIQDSKELISFHICLRDQYMKLCEQKQNILNIKKLNNEISEIKNIIEDLSFQNKNDKIIPILKEFCLIDGEHSKNAIISIKDPSKMDIELVTTKAKGILNKVLGVLN